MNMHNVSVGSINNFQELRAQLFCQQNAGSNNNCGGAIVDNIMTTLSVNNHRQSLATTSGNNHLTFVVCKHTIKDAILMWAKSDHQKELDNNSINQPTHPVKGVVGDSRHY
jgi:hypothetical protein